MARALSPLGRPRRHAAARDASVTWIRRVLAALVVPALACGAPRSGPTPTGGPAPAPIANEAPSTPAGAESKTADTTAERAGAAQTAADAAADNLRVRVVAESEAEESIAPWQEIAVVSPSLSQFHGREVVMRAVVIEPGRRSRDGEDPLPLVLDVHGFGGNHRLGAMSNLGEIRRGLADERVPRLLWVFLDASWDTGHHVFANSPTNGPWRTALTDEFVPALERHYGAGGIPAGRLLTGHSSGGWSTLWLQIDAPEFFGGTWSTAPDPVDFRNFTGVDIYTWDNAYRSPKGETVQLMRRGDKFVMSLEDYTREEMKTQPTSGQMYSFDAVFSPVVDGKPRHLFDRETGAIDREVAEAWRQWDIARVLERDWARLSPLLAGKIHVFCGTADTFRLNESLALLEARLADLGSDASIVWVEGRDHFDLYAPHDTLFARGLHARIYAEMRATWDRAGARAALDGQRRGE